MPLVPGRERSLRRRRAVGRRRHDLSGCQVAAQATRTDRIHHVHRAEGDHHARPTSTRNEWAAARHASCSRREGAHAAQRRAGAAAAGAAMGRIEKEYRFETDEGSASLADLFRGRSSYSSTISCSGLTIRRGVQPARRLPTGSTASASTWPTTTSRFRRCRGRRSKSCRRTSSGWGGRFPGRPRPAATTTATSASRSPSSSSAREASNTTTSASRRGRQAGLATH